MLAYCLVEILLLVAFVPSLRFEYGKLGPALYQFLAALCTHYLA